MANFFKEIQFYLVTLKLQIQSSATLKFTFWSQIISMILNNSILLLPWVFLFNQTGTLNNWSIKEVLMLQSITAISYGLIGVLMNGVLDLTIILKFKKFDNYLISPKSTLFQIFGFSTNISAIGDIMQGLLLFLFTVLVYKMSFIPSSILMIIGAIFSTSLYMCIVSAITFLNLLVDDNENASEKFLSTLLSIGLYPSGIFPEKFKFIFTYIIPAIAIGGLPGELITTKNLTLIIPLILLTLFWFMLATVIYKLGINRIRNDGY